MKKYYVVLYCFVDDPSEVIGLYEDLDEAKKLAEKRCEENPFSWTEIHEIGMNSEYILKETFKPEKNTLQYIDKKWIDNRN